MEFSIEARRVGNAAAALKKLEERLVRNAKDTTQAVAKMLMEESREQAPEETGALKKSAYVSEEAVVEDGFVVSKFGFGKKGFTFTGPLKPYDKGRTATRHPYDYAKPVHERIAAADGGGRFDFINVAIELRTADIHAIVRDRMRRP